MKNGEKIQILDFHRKQIWISLNTLLLPICSDLRQFSKGSSISVWTDTCTVLATGIIPVSGWDLPTEGLQSEPEGQDTDLATRLDNQPGNQQGCFPFCFKEVGNNSVPFVQGLCGYQHGHMAD